jgi:hypothetical protein
MRPGAEIYSIAALPAERIAVGCRDGRIHVLDADLTPTATFAAPGGAAWDLTATESELFVGQKHSLGLFSFGGEPTRPPVTLSAMLLRLGRYGSTVLAGLSTDELGRVDRGAFESLGVGLALGMSGGDLIVLRSNHLLERVPIDGEPGGSPRMVGCAEIDQPFEVVSSAGARGGAIVGRHAVAWLPSDADRTTSEWVAPTRIESCVALNGRSLLVACGHELWVLEDYLLQ